MRKVAIIGTVGVPANYGGFETLVKILLANIVQMKFNILCIVVARHIIIS